MVFPLTEHVAKSARHTTFYLACGAADAPPIVFVHGWPELSASWRHQLPCFASLGFRAIAPDMRGYGRSSVYPRHEDYALQHAVADMLELLASLGRERCVWVGHDWGAPVVWSLASHHPQACVGVANLCVPYFAKGFCPDEVVPFVDRTIYPEARFPAGQWDYQLFYEERFDDATRALEADVRATVRALFRKGNPAKMREPSRLATVRSDGGWFGGMGRAPELPLDTDVLSPEDLEQYTAALQRNGFFGPNAWYMNHARNQAFAASAGNGGRIDLPVLYLHGQFDATCETLVSRLADPMRRDCSRLTEGTVPSGHWMAQERPTVVNAALVRWLARELPAYWPT
jgi:pimeloyl-ACP methyl ester carboxylesterase